MHFEAYCPLFPSAAIFNKEEDIATYTIEAVDDPRTLNKILYIIPPANVYSFNDLVTLWERKIGKTLERIYVPEEQLLQKIQGQYYWSSKKTLVCFFILRMYGRKPHAKHFVWYGFTGFLGLLPL